MKLGFSLKIKNWLLGIAALAIPFVVAGTHCVYAQSNVQATYLGTWPEGRSPREIGSHVAQHFVVSPHMSARPLIYPEFCAWYGALEFARVSGDTALSADLIKRFQPMLTSAESALIPDRRHVDEEIFGILPLEIYLITHDQKYLQMGLVYADRQWEPVRSDGLSPETRFWIDDMYMMTILQLQAYRATNNRKYIDRAAFEMAAYLDKLQEPNGLFYHAPDVPIYWSRGNGWIAAGMAEMLTSLPLDHPLRPRILAGYRSMMKALLINQGKDGMWRELLDDDAAWPETSGSAMFTFAFATGVRNGWLDEATYGSATRRAWIAVSGYVDQNWDLTNVCEGTNKVNDREFYLLRKRKTGDFHGQAPMMWAATALLR
jgi:unsaturated rhamnogalacturonyl hydrolase